MFLGWVICGHKVHTCPVSCDYVPRRSWPLFRARELMHGVIASFEQKEPNPWVKSILWLERHRAFALKSEHPMPAQLRWPMSTSSVWPPPASGRAVLMRSPARMARKIFWPVCPTMSERVLVSSMFICVYAFCMCCTQRPACVVPWLHRSSPALLVSSARFAAGAGRLLR